MGKKKHKASKNDDKQNLKTEKALQRQDSLMWEQNAGISQLEGRIATHNWQG